MKAPEGTATEAIGASEFKESGKGKAVEATTSEEKSVSEKSRVNPTKKPRSTKKRAPKIQKRNIISDDEETEEDQPAFKRKISDPEKDQPASEDMDTDANTGNLNSINDNVPILQAQTSPISPSSNQPHSESNDDIDPSLLQQINVIHPPKIFDLPNITSDT
ncbi:hypothetical protein A2U01_0045446, partial [Trifolium medium]|nr:hypothetical protein [Trifolium medium]